MADVQKDVTILQTADLYIYYADYDRLDYITEKRPSRDNKSILMCVAGAFQSTYQLSFNEDNIVGWHTSNGRLERGAPQSGLGAFTYVGGHPVRQTPRFFRQKLRRGAEICMPSVHIFLPVNRLPAVIVARMRVVHTG